MSHTPRHRQGRTHLTGTVPPQSHSSTLWAARTQGRSCDSDLGRSTALSGRTSADSHDGEVVQTADLFMVSIPNDIRGQGEQRNTHRSPKEVTASSACPPFLLLSGLCFTEVTGASTQDHFAKRVSVLDALQTGWFCPWVNSSEQQLRVFATEISSR